jgi:predicted transcriptional regulator
MLKITEMEAQKVDLHLTTKIVRSYVGHHAIDADQVSELITSVHGALSQLRWSKEPEEVPTPAVPVRQSVQHDYVVCLDCGFRGKMLRRHISKRHGLRRNEYLKRWGLRRDHPLTAPGYSEQRSSTAKERGLGRKAASGVAPAPISVGSVQWFAEQKKSG